MMVIAMIPKKSYFRIGNLYIPFAPAGPMGAPEKIILKYFQHMIKSFLPRACSLLLAFSLVAQTDMVWDTHGVGFTVPDDFEIETNNAEEFTAGNDVLFLSLLPIQDEDITTDDLSDAVLDMAKELKYDSIEEGDDIDIDDFTGYYIKGRKEGANAVFMALLDKHSSTNLLVVVVYADGYEDDAVAIAASLYAYD